MSLPEHVRIVHPGGDLSPRHTRVLCASTGQELNFITGIDIKITPGAYTASLTIDAIGLDIIAKPTWNVSDEDLVRLADHRGFDLVRRERNEA